LPPEIPSVDRIRHVHLVAVAGTGMGTLACMLAGRGLRVTGSDSGIYPPMSEQLAAAGIDVRKGFDADNVLAERPDLVVIGNAVRRDNPEARAVEEARIPRLSFPDAVHHLFLRGKHAIVVAGTHGKTTCTSLLGWILTHAGLDPSVLVGGVAGNFGSGFRLGEGEYFVIEGDEYDTAYFDKTPKFLHYAPRTVLFTSCEFDHADIYSSLEGVKEAFRSLVALVPADGGIVAGTDSPIVREVLEAARAPVEGYGFRAGTRWQVSDVAFDPEGTAFTVWRGEERLARVRLPMHGSHNVENALGVIAVATRCGVEPKVAAAAAAEFRGVRRRQEVRGEVDGVVVVDDFAHHPTAVRATIAAVRARFPDRTLWAIFEPRTHTSRRRVFETEFGQALGRADRVVIADVYRPDQIPEQERFRPEEVVSALRSVGVEAEHVGDVGEIVELFLRRRSGRDVALVMSNGDFGGLCERLLGRLRAGH
jgi:UDP-N-acetylmuramate: L-alanyl-gamma-D-glutamyl-meso-diaminopimelate ligase